MRPTDRFIVSEDRPTYSQVPTPLLNAVRDRKLPVSAAGYYAMLDGYRNRKTGRCDPALSTLSADTGLSIPTIRKYNEVLVAGRFIRIEPGGGPRQAQRYILMYSPEWPKHDVVGVTERILQAPQDSRATSRASSCATANCTELYKQDEQDGKKEKSGAEPPIANNGHKQKPPIHKIAEDWHDTYLSVVGQKPLITSKHMAILTRMLNHYGEEPMGAMIGNFFHPTGKAVRFTVENFFNLGDKLYQEVKGRVYGDTRTRV